MSLRLSFSVDHDVNRAAEAVGRLPGKLTAAMRDATPQATKELENVVERALVSKAGGAYWPIRSQADASAGRGRVVVSKSKAHRIEPTKEHGILANPETGFFVKGGVDHPGSNPPRGMLPVLEASPLGEVEREYTVRVERVLRGGL